MKIKKVFIFFAVICITSDISFGQNFKVPPLASSSETNGAKIFNLQLQRGTTSFFPGIETATAGYNGNYLGPTIVINKGDSVVMNVTNTMEVVTTTHWHGIHLPGRMDGGPHQLIPQNTTWRATWVVKNRAGTYWYHPHPHSNGAAEDTMRTTGWQVYQGMSGMIIVKDAETDSLGLPDEYGVDDIPIILQDRAFNVDSTKFEALPLLGSGRPDLRKGETILINGVVTPALNTHAQMIRLRILNASNGRSYRLGFSDNRLFFVIGSDGGLLDTASEVTRLAISPAERYEILVDFGDDNGKTIKLMAYNSEIQKFNYPSDGGVGTIYWNPTMLDSMDVSDFPVMTFNVGAPTANAVHSFNTKLTSITKIDPNSAVNLASPRPFVLTNAISGAHTYFFINGLSFDMSRIDDIITLGDTEVWEFVNRANMAHPMHVHGNSFQIISRENGPRPIRDYELGWKDVTIVYPGETVRIIKKFEDYADPDSPYMMHCHILEHEDAGMMTQWIVVEDPTSVENVAVPVPSEFSLEQNYPNPFNPTTTIEYSLEKANFVTLEVYDLLGREIKTLVNEFQEIGIYHYRLAASDLASGTYWYRLKVGSDFIETRMMTVLR